VLDRTADAAGNVGLQRDDLASLTDLPVVGCIARIDRGAARAERRAERRAELVGQRREPSVNLSLDPIARPPETIILARRELGCSS